MEEGDTIEDINQTTLAVDFNLKDTSKFIGAGFINNDKKILQLVEFEDNDYFSNLESLIIQMNDEANRDTRFQVLINIPRDESYKTRILDIFSQCEVEFTVAKKSDFNSKEVEVMLNSLLKNSFSFYEEESSQVLALGALSCAINFTKINENSANHNKFDLLQYSMNNYVRLDIAAMTALNLFPQNLNSAGMANGTEITSIFEIINKAKTSIGSRLIKRWLKQPIRDESEINRRLDIVEFFCNENEARSTISNDHLRQFPDIEKLHIKFYKVKNNLPQRATLVDCVKVYNLVTNLQNLVEFFENLALKDDHPIEKNYNIIIKGIINDFENLKTMIEESIDINKVSKGDYIINPDYSEALRELYDQIDAKSTEIDEYRDKLNKEFNFARPITITEHQSSGILFEVNKKEGDVALRKSKESFEVLSTKKGYIAFTSKQLRNIVSDIQELQEQYKIEQNQLVIKVLDIVATYFPVLERASNVVSELDALVSFANASTSDIAYCRPIISESNQKIILTDSRHPLIEKMNSAGCISNDCNMVRDASNLQIITGPNMGGKSTYIRQVAINVLLAHIGCFVPCRSAEVPILDSIIARVGASDHQLKGVSTFMAEMLEASCLLHSATKDSLIIMDELGRGTSTNEGFGLAWGIAQYLAETINCYTFFATHFHELTSIDKEVSNAKNFYVDAHAEENKLIMLYKVKEGVIDRSYGIHVAEMLNFPQDIIDESRMISKQLEDFNNASYKV